MGLFAFTGRSAAWLARLVRDQEVGGSNPPAPTMVRRGKVSKETFPCSGWAPFDVFAMRKSLHIYYSGTVQGVGFRFTVESTAAGLGLGGWVKNLSDGRVEVFCEGGEADLIFFANRINSGPMKNYISSQNAVWGESKNEFRDFTVRS